MFDNNKSILYFEMKWEIYHMILLFYLILLYHYYDYAIYFPIFLFF
jgi:hypothetical protein